MEPDAGDTGLSLRGAVALPLLEWMRRRLATDPDGRRPVLALNGPVGAGKSTTGRLLRQQATELGLRLAVASIDDLYYPLAERLERMRGNPFGVSRVPPGSHDIPLLLQRIETWRAGGPLRLPRFDKRLAGGQGDRAGETEEEADALVLEGWLMGCRCLGERAMADLEGGLEDRLADWPLSPEEWHWLPRWDRALADYEPLWQACDGLWLLRPQRWTLPRRWRFQAEARQRRAGGSWLSGRELEQLVRASLHALPPPLYQDPLIIPPWMPARPDGSPATPVPDAVGDGGTDAAGPAEARQPGGRAAAGAGFQRTGDDRMQWNRSRPGGEPPGQGQEVDGAAPEWPGSLAEPAWDQADAAPATSGRRCGRQWIALDGGDRPVDDHERSLERQARLTGQLPLLGITLLTARRTCLAWPQASPSSASSEIG